MSDQPTPQPAVVEVRIISVNDRPSRVKKVSVMVSSARQGAR